MTATLKENDRHWAETWEERFDREQARRRGADTRTMTTEEIILGSSFALGTGGKNGAPAWGAWGSFSTGGFEGDVDGVTLNGDVTTGVIGADVSQETWLAGLAISSSKGDGPYRLTGDEAANGEIESTLTALYPYARFELSDRVDAWGLAGVGTGNLTIKKDRGSPMTTDLGMTMGAIGTRGKLLEAGPNGGLDLALKSDAMRVRMKSEEVHEDDGILAGARADVTRVRLILEGSRAFAMEQGRTFTPWQKSGCGTTAAMRRPEPGSKSERG